MTAEPPPLRDLLPVLLFTVGYICAASAAAAIAGNGEFVIYIFVMVVVGLAIWRVHRAITLPNSLLWALSIWGLAHMLGGLMPIPDAWPRHGDAAVLYNFWLLPGYLKYDQLVHAYGFGITTLVFWHGLARIVERSSGRAPHPSGGLLLIAAAAGVGMGALNEVIEFGTTLVLEETNVGDYSNTGWDLVFNLGGAALAVLAIRLRSRQAGAVP